MTAIKTIDGIKFLETPASSDGSWIHTEGSDYIFYFKFNSWTDTQNKIMANAFLSALSLPNKIKQAVKDTSGQSVLDGLYTQDEAAMTKAMNNVNGMAQTSSNLANLSGNGTIRDANESFFQSVLSGVGGSVNPMMDYLNNAMAGTQAAAGNDNKAKHFGTTITLLALTPGLDIPVTTVIYAYTEAESASVLIKHKCKSDEQKFSYNVNYTKVGYLYQP
ncbi:hypothetical protein P0Y67_18310 [Photobacterium sp. SP02]|uniref:hypothetical protein n=1 Tax=Photobacterium sp. SP02 TaxID=3032280 RepID=UPI003144E252